MRTVIALIALLTAGCSRGGAEVATPTPVTPAPVVTEAPPDLSGLGIIEFGTSYDEDSLTIPKPTARFKRTIKSIAWSAQLTEPANATSLELIVASVSKTGVEKVIVKTDVDVSDPDFSIFANEVDLGLLLDRKAGTYVMRYLRESKVLAEGEFTLVK